MELLKVSGKTEYLCADHKILEGTTIAIGL